MIKSVGILQSNYIPWKGYFDLISKVDEFVFYDIVKYTKNDWRNRNVIYSKNGTHWLTIPISAKSVNLNINQVEFVNQQWREKHIKSLMFSYKSAAHFKQLEEFVQLFLIDNCETNLSRFNSSIIMWIAGKLKLGTNFTFAEDLNPKGDRVERLIDILKYFGANEYLSGPSAKLYIEDSLHEFESIDCEVKYMTYTDYPEYKQLGAEMRHDVSILDLIAHISWEDIPDYIHQRTTLK